MLVARYEIEGGRVRDGGRLRSIWWSQTLDTWFDDHVRRVMGDTAMQFSVGCMDGERGVLRFRRLFNLEENEMVIASEMFYLDE